MDIFKTIKPKHIGIFTIVLVIITSLPRWPIVQRLDLSLYDWQSNIIRHTKTQEVLQKEVVLIGIDKNTYKQLNEPFALWHNHFADLFKALSLSEITIFGLDIAFPDRSFNPIIPGIDQTLLRAMLILKRKAPIVLGTTIHIDADTRETDTREVYGPYLSAAGGAKGQAFVLWFQDDDRVVRTFKENLGTPEKPVNPLVKTMAEHLKQEVSSGLIDYTLGAPIHYISMQQVLEWYHSKNFGQLKQTFGQKAVIIGTVLPFEDRHYQPVNLAAWEKNNNNFVPGVLLHVQALRNILNGGFIQQLDLYTLYILNFIIAFLWFLGKKIYVVFLLILCSATLLLGTQYVLLTNSIYLPISAALLGMLTALGGRQLYEAIIQVLERQRLRKSFSGYVSPQVMDEILKGSIKPGIYGERKHICILFSDIRSFTTISEKMQPEDVIRFLNKYLGAMTDAIQGHGGTIDKFMGDGIMAFFGAPKSSETPALDAFNAAKDKLKKLQELNQEFAENKSMPLLKIGIGLHFGDAVVGNIGSEQRNEYTAIGDVVNTASRLEGLTKQAGYPIVVSDVVADALKENVNFDCLGEMPVKGRANVTVFGWPPKAQGE